MTGQDILKMLEAKKAQLLATLCLHERKVGVKASTLCDGEKDEDVCIVHLGVWSGTHATALQDARST